VKNTQYLVQIGSRWYCRVRWPKEVWGTLGDGSFKKSLGTDSHSEAVTRLPGALHEFQSRVAKAKAHQLESAHRTPKGLPSARRRQGGETPRPPRRFSIG